MVGRTKPPCESGSRWHKFVFTLFDHGRELVVAADEVPGVFTLRIDGLLRGEVDTWNGQAHDAALPSKTYTICSTRGKDYIGAGIGVSEGDCADRINIDNPAISFTAPDLELTQVVILS
jgi:hypothetical protein